VIYPGLSCAASAASSPNAVVAEPPVRGAESPVEGIAVSEADLLLPLPEVLEHSDREPFRYCLNTSTLRGHGLSLPELVDIAAGAGYEAIEPWIDEVERYEADGGDLRALAERIRDLGLTVEGGIGFFEWVVDDTDRRARGLAAARHAMGLLARIGGKRIAAPPTGVHESGAARLDLLAAGERYRDLLLLGDECGVAPIVEFWGFSANLSRLCEAALIAVDSGHPDAAVLADVYHLYKGGSPPSGLRLLSPAALPLFHVNDYPEIPPADIVDADRVYPGDGIAPLTQILRSLRAIGFTGVLSLELFNVDYYKQDPRTVAKTGLEKLRAVVMRSGD
jgi:sugar phosphate isomerase/epimerase